MGFAKRELIQSIGKLMGLDGGKNNKAKSLVQVLVMVRYAMYMLNAGQQTFRKNVEAMYPMEGGCADGH